MEDQSRAIREAVDLKSSITEGEDIRSLQSKGIGKANDTYHVSWKFDAYAGGQNLLTQNLMLCTRNTNLHVVLDSRCTHQVHHHVQPVTNQFIPRIVGDSSELTPKTCTFLAPSGRVEVWC